jgi:N-acetylmuramoyl-L-alanine amidase
VTFGLQNRSRFPLALALAVLCLLLFGAPFRALAKGAATKRARVTRQEGRRASAQAVQQRRLEHGKAALTRLRGDARRRRYRDGWEAIARELDAAVRADPSGRRAAEAALWAARSREERWKISRIKVDALAAIAAYRSVDERYAGSEPAAHALAAAVQLAVRVKSRGEAASAARRLSRYPKTAEASAALAIAPERTAPAPVARKASRRAADAGDATRAARKLDRAAQKPLEIDDTASEDAPSRLAPPAPGAATAARRPSREESRGGRDAPASPDRESDTDVPAEATRVLDELVEASRGAASASAASGAAALASGKEAAGGAVEQPEAAAKESAQTGEAADADTEGEDAPSSAANDRQDDLPELKEDSPAKTAHRARELRTSALAQPDESVAAQLGLKVRRVVIDPGHGGRDTGAIGPHGLREKDVALAIARKLAARLRAQGLVVVLTRDRDIFVPLDDRTRIANESRADLFVSIHCNAARKRHLSGVETWTLNVASSRYAARLAAFENAADERTVSDLRLILADLATKANASDARELASAVQTSLVRNLRARVGSVRDNGIKQALFYVLLGTHMPSILVETAFLSNPEEEKRLRSERYQEGTAEAIARGVRDFLDGRRKLALAP